MGREPNHERRRVEYPKDLCDPKDYLRFIQLDPYAEAFAGMKLTDDEQRAIETAIMMDPIRCPIIEGTGGIREYDFSTTPKPHASLSFNVYYAYFPEKDTVCLIDLIDIGEVGPFDFDELKELKEMFEEIQTMLDG